MKNYLLQYIENHKDKMLKDLADFVAIPSISSDKEKVLEVYKEEGYTDNLTNYKKD